MNTRVLGLTAIGILVMGVMALGQAQPPGAPPNPPEVAGTDGVPAVESQIIPKGTYTGVTLDDMIHTLKDAVPGFDATVIRSAQAPVDYPKFDNFSPKNVTIGQFVDLVRSSFPGVEVQRIDGSSAPLYVFRVGTGNLINSIPVGWNSAPAQDQSAQIVHVFPLQPALNALGDTSKESLDNVLSLLQTAVQQQTGNTEAILKVHEPTLMLVFKGTPAQMAVLQQALAALQPQVDTNSEIVKTRMKYEQEMAMMQSSRQGADYTIADLQAQLKKSTEEAEEMRVQAAKLQAEVDALQKQLSDSNNKH